jgi:hypothetical protein
MYWELLVHFLSIFRDFDNSIIKISIIIYLPLITNMTTSGGSRDLTLGGLQLLRMQMERNQVFSEVLVLQKIIKKS